MRNCLDLTGRVAVVIGATSDILVTVCEEQWSSLMDTSLIGALRACPLFRVAAYCAAKSALLSLTRSQACEWARDGISVDVIAPGILPTELNNELVGAAVMLSPDATSFLTGQCIAVDGGYLASGVNS